MEVSAISIGEAFAENAGRPSANFFNDSVSGDRAAVRVHFVAVKQESAI